MKDYLHTARQVIDFFDKELHFKMSESNFTKHKKAGIFKKYKQDGKKGVYYKLPEAAVDYFNQVDQRNEKGWKAIDKLDVYMKKYEAEKNLIEKIDTQWSRLLKVPVLESTMFDTKESFDTKEELEDFEGYLSECSVINHDRCVVFVKIIQELTGKYSNFNNTNLQHDLIEIMANQITSPSDIAELEEIKLIEDVEVEYTRVYHPN